MSLSKWPGLSGMISPCQAGHWNEYHMLPTPQLCLLSVSLMTHIYPQQWLLLVPCIPHICMFLWWSGMSGSSPTFRICLLIHTHLLSITSTFGLPPTVIIPHLCLSLCGQAWQEGVHHGNHIIRCIPICYSSLNFFPVSIVMISFIIMFAGGHTMSNAPDLF